MTWLLSILLVVHGAIHLLGFVEWSGLVDVRSLSGWTAIPLSSTGRWFFALLWLFAGLLLISAAGLRMARQDAWWIVALFGVVVSQALIGISWRDAKFGTVANVLLLLPIIAAGAHARFVSATESMARTLLDGPRRLTTERVSRADLSSLPDPVGRWLERAGILGNQRIRTVRLKQTGALRTSPEGAWLPAQAEQYFSVDEPAFVWRVEARMGGVVPLDGRDTYAAGRGRMLIKAASLLTLVDAHDDKIAQGALLRYLGEMVWFPSAALAPYVDWEAIDAKAAQVTMRHAGLSASAVMHFDEEGRVVGLSAERYLGDGAEAKLTPWIVSCTDWRRFEGIEVPVQGDVGWKLPSGDFSYYEWQIVDLDYEPTGPFERRGASR